MKSSILFLASAVFFSGCATLPKNFDATHSISISQDESTPLGDLFKPDLKKNPGKSGFHVLNIGRDAFLARLALAETATRTLDCQYFIWNGDRSGIVLLERIVRAADRGVRVRLLLDDMTSHGKDLGLSALNHHPNIEIRVFNPLGRRYYFGIFRMMSLALHVGRMTNRMHNKLFVADNQAAIVGGRNIADEYFGIDKRSNFRDMDLFAVGPIVAGISTAFDDYWNSPWAVPFEVFKTRLPSEKKFQKKKEKLQKRFVQMEEKFPYPLFWDKEKFLKIFEDTKSDLIWADAEIVTDPPGKAWQKAERGKSKSEIVNKLEQLMTDSKNEVLVISPYLILSKEDVKALSKLDQRGLSLRIFTNSLKSTDAVPVVAMYRKIRKPMLAAGVDLYEMRPDAESRRLQADPSVSKARLSLHAKAVVFDREKVFIGTFNVDPRSEHLNTEVGLLVHDKRLAEQIAADFEKDLEPVNSYSVRLNEQKNRMVWVCEENGKEKTYTSDPKSGFWLRFQAGFLGLLPISNQL